MSDLLSIDEINRLHSRIQEMELSQEEKDRRSKLVDDFVEAIVPFFKYAKAAIEYSDDDDMDTWYYLFIEECTDSYISVLDKNGLTSGKYAERAENASKEISTTILNSYADGKSLDDIFSERKVATIAETETNILSNTRMDDEAREAGYTKKTWVTMGDEKVRIAHALVDNVTIGIDDAFDVEGYAMKYPCDTSDNPDASLVVNCRCICQYS